MTLVSRSSVSPRGVDLEISLSPLSPADLPQIERLDARCYGPGRFARSAYRLREGVAPAFALSRVARIGTLLVGANLITPILVGDGSGLLLGPLTVEPAYRSRGIGEALVLASLAAARAANHTLVLLVGDQPYYARMGFKPVRQGRLTLPGPVDPARLMVCELQPGAFASRSGPVRRAL